MNKNLVIVERPEIWKLALPNAEVVSAKSYLNELQYKEEKRYNVYNLCRSYQYQSIGYYVSLLAQARGHRVMPDILTIQDLKNQTIVKVISGEMDGLIQKELKGHETKELILNVYFGKCLNNSFEILARKLFETFRAPFLRVIFQHDDKWEIKSVKTIPFSEIPALHYESLEKFASDYFNKKTFPTSKAKNYHYDLAILYNPKSDTNPSDAKALKNFIAAANQHKIHAELITKDDLDRIPEFDALFIRETTNVHHYTYRFSRMAEAEGLVVIDDPQSILRCSNKVYLKELLETNKIPTPKTMILHSGNVEEVLQTIGLPCILKRPDSAFSQGVHKVMTAHDYYGQVEKLLNASDLIIVQEFLPTEFDWRIGILNNRPLYACKYYMAKGHWQVINNAIDSKKNYGDSETLHLESVPRKILQIAVKCSKLIGDGLYGVDIKQIGNQCCIIEINDNPNIDAGCEDQILKNKLYNQVIQHFLDKLNERQNSY